MLLISTAQAALRAQRLARRQGAALPTCIDDDKLDEFTPQQHITHMALHATRAVTAAASVCLPAFQRASIVAPSVATPSTFSPPTSQGTATVQGPSARTQRRTQQRERAREVATRTSPPAKQGLFSTAFPKTQLPTPAFEFGKAAATSKPPVFIPAKAGARTKYSEAVGGTASTSEASLGEKRSGNTASTAPIPPRNFKRGKCGTQGEPKDVDIADLEYEDSLYLAGGLALDELIDEGGGESDSDGYY